jgi:hypothetical protein
MPQYWLKPLGTTEPRKLVDDDWISERGLDDYELTTGPATPRQPPKMGRGDRVLLHAVGESRVYAEGEILGNPRHEPTRLDGDRWPWVYPLRIDVWVPLISDGPKTGDLAANAIGRIQWGAAYAPLDRAEYTTILEALTACPTVQRRPQQEPTEIADAEDAMNGLSRGQGFSPRLTADDRRAVEMQAMQIATAHFEGMGFVVEDVSAKRSYDLRCRRGVEHVDVEVKGTTTAGESVLLTPNEVEHARAAFPNTALVVVRDITLHDDGSGASGGVLGVIRPWRPQADDLEPLGYIYVVPNARR